MTELLSNVSLILDYVIDWTGDIVSMIVQTPLIFMFVTLSVSLVAIGVVKRLIRL